MHILCDICTIPTFQIDAAKDAKLQLQLTVMFICMAAGNRLDLYQLVSISCLAFGNNLCQFECNQTNVENLCRRESNYKSRMK